MSDKQEKKVVVETLAALQYVIERGGGNIYVPEHDAKVLTHVLQQQDTDAGELVKEAEEQFRLWHYTNQDGIGNVTGSEGILLDLLFNFVTALQGSTAPPEEKQ